MANADYFSVDPQGTQDHGQVLLNCQDLVYGVRDGITQVQNTVNQWIGSSAAAAQEIRQLATSLANDFAILHGMAGSHLMSGADQWVGTDNAAARTILPG